MRYLSRLPFGLALIACLLTIPSVAHGTLYVRVADADMADQAPIIVEASVQSSNHKSAVDKPATDYLIHVDRLVAGSLDGSSLVVRVPGGIGPDGMELYIYGAPQLAVGESALLFLTPRSDGTYAVMHFMQGFFRISEVDGQRVAWRHFTDVEELPGQKSLHPEGPRHLERFSQWLSDHKQGTVREADYWMDGDIGPLIDKFTFIESGTNGRPFRWREFDTGGSVRWNAHQGGQPNLPGGGFQEFQDALAAWTNESTTPIRYFYAGQTSASAGFTGFDGVNAILFDDPNSNFDTPFNCGTGGTLAAGGPWSSLAPTVFNGTTYNIIAGADIVVNRGTGCLIARNDYAREIFGHELGHTLGLGHSCGDQNSPGCSPGSVLDEALMRANAHGDNRGARLNSDDRAGLRVLYQQTVLPTPDRPGNLQAFATGPGSINISWRDNSTNENSFEIQRALDGGDFEDLIQLPADSEFHIDVDAVSGRAHVYRVRARNASGPSAWSNTSLAVPPGEIAPSDLTATTRSTTVIDLAWVDNGSTETGYEIEASEDNGETFDLVTTLPADSTSFSVEELTIATSYTFRVRSIGGAGTSSYTPIATASTFLQEAALCQQSANHFCLGEQRFRVEIEYRDFADNTGLATRVDLGTIAPADSGLYYFFTPNNWEFLVKVLDGCGFNDRFWVFAAATTDIEYTLRVKDEWSGLTAEYFNPLGTAAPAITDTDAIATCGALPPLDAGTTAASTLTAADLEAARADFLAQWQELNADKTSPCEPSATAHCLNGGRFRVEVEWRDFEDASGFGQTVPLESVDSGLFYFFGADNWEMLVKVIDGCNFNDRFWVFSAATTNIEYTLRVTDTATGEVREFDNPLGTSADAVTDTNVFATCP